MPCRSPRHLSPPDLYMDGLSSEEVGVAWNLSISFRRLVDHTNEFRGALVLFNFCSDCLAAVENGQCETNLPLRLWRLMAGRDGAMSLYHFGCTIEEIQRIVGKYAVFAPKVNRQALREARKML